MKDLTVIIPVVDLSTPQASQLFVNAYDSVDDSNIIVVGPQEAIDKAKLAEVRKNNANTEYLVNKGNTCYAAQVNLAVNKVSTKYFSVLEADDIYSDVWFNNVQKYIDIDVDETLGFLPLTEVIDFNSNEIIGYANEAVWASSFSEKIGYLDLNSSLEYLNYNTSGAVFRTDTFKMIGGLKESMKLVFWYEFILRALYKNKVLFVIPKIGYYHYVNREGTITVNYRNEMSEKEADWWIDLAKKEYFFPQDRKRTYEE